MKTDLLERNLPDLLTMNDGTPVTAEKWPQRKAELLDALQKYLYGYTPEAPKEVRAESLGSSVLVSHGRSLRLKLNFNFKSTIVGVFIIASSSRLATVFSNHG